MESSTLKPHQISFLEITADQAGQRIDNFLRTYLKGVPKSHVYRILRTGEVRVNKGRVKPLYRLQAGDRLRLPPVQFNTPTLPSPRRVQELTNTILYEDAQLLIIDKPAGLAVHGGSGIEFGVIEGLRALYPKLHYLELVHRLDRDTSGCLMIAKKSSMLRRLHELLRQSGINKQYLALVQGRWHPRLTVVEANLRKNILLSGERIVRVHADGKPSQTQFGIEQRFANATLLRVQPLTGRTHQIRVHTAYMGHPVAGDSKYGDEAFNQQMRDYHLTRLFLHATQLEINLPGQDHLLVQAPLPANLQQVLHHLKNNE
jgi:23S rRNA pseudouridine955/2504/2580 synthase